MQDGGANGLYDGAPTIDDDNVWLISQIQSLRHKLKLDKRELMSFRMKCRAMIDNRGKGGEPPDIWAILQQLMNEVKDKAFAIDENIEALRIMLERLKERTSPKASTSNTDDTAGRCLLFIHKFLSEALQLLDDPSFFGNLSPSNFFEKRLLSTWKHVMGDNLPPDWAKQPIHLDTSVGPKSVMTQTIASQLAQFLDICVKQISVEAAKTTEADIIDQKDAQLAALADGICVLHQQHTAQLQQRDELIRQMQQEAIEAAKHQADLWLAQSEEHKQHWVEFYKRMAEQYECHLKTCQQQFAHFSQTKLRAYKEKCESQPTKLKSPNSCGTTEEGPDTPEGTGPKALLSVPPLLLDHTLKRLASPDHQGFEKVSSMRTSPGDGDGSQRHADSTEIVAPWLQPQSSPRYLSSPRTPVRQGSLCAIRPKGPGSSSFVYQPPSLSKNSTMEDFMDADAAGASKRRSLQLSVETQPTKSLDAAEQRKANNAADKPHTEHKKVPSVAETIFRLGNIPIGMSVSGLPPND